MKRMPIPLPSSECEHVPAPLGTKLILAAGALLGGIGLGLVFIGILIEFTRR